jgi:hypothetical protein
MKLGAFPLQEGPCPKCSVLVPSAVVYSIPDAGIGTHFTFDECPQCGTLVHRIVGFDIANPKGNNLLRVEDVSKLPFYDKSASTQVIQDNFSVDSK